jgi:hypothetical protein
MKESHFLLTDWKLDPDIRKWYVSLFSNVSLFSINSS